MLQKEPPPGSSSQRIAFAGLLLLLGCFSSWLWLPHPLIFPLQPQLVQGEQLGFLCASRSWQEHEGGFELGFELLTPLMWCWEAPEAAGVAEPSLAELGLGALLQCSSGSAFTAWKSNTGKAWELN